MQDFTLNKGKLAIMLAGLFCLYAVYGAVSDFKLPGQAEALEPVDPIVELDPVNIQLLTKTHLFGQPPQVKVAATKKVNNSKRSTKVINKRPPKAKQQTQKKRNTEPIKINVTVTGLLASADTDYSAAILKIDNKPEKLYKVGEDLGKPEVKLQRVDQESVVIDNNGNEQTIVMNRPGLESSDKTNPRGSNRRVSNRNENLIPELPPELELLDEEEYLESAAAQGAYTPSPSESLDDDFLSYEELEEESLLEQMQDELDEEFQAEQDFNNNPPQEDAITTLEQLKQANPDFKMPVF